MEKRVDVAIIGAGTAGITAFKEAWKVKKNILLINSGPHGTTCARIGCMPSKTFIQIAGEFYRRHLFPGYGITGSGDLAISIPDVMKKVRSLRDYFVSGVMKTIEEIGDKNLQGSARFLEPNVLEVDSGIRIIAERIIIATGAEPLVPGQWRDMGDKILTTDRFFEEEDLPRSMGVIGLGVIGLELGQAMARLGIDITALNGTDFIGGLTDPEVNRVAVEIFSKEMDITLNRMAEIRVKDKAIEISTGSGYRTAGKVLASMGRKPRVSGLGLDKIGIPLNKGGLPSYNPLSMQIEGFPIFIAGDANGDRPLLHEAIDEGRIAGYNAVREEPVNFRRRAGLSITFCEPNIATAGKRFMELKDRDIIIGETGFSTQGRSVILSENRGLLRLYGDPADGRLLGAEMIAPRGEHLAHHLSWCIQTGLNVFDAASLPFYHPVVEEGLQNALKNLAGKVKGKRKENDLMYCQGHPVDCLK